jgi:putative transposase
VTATLPSHDPNGRGLTPAFRVVTVATREQLSRPRIGTKSAEYFHWMPRPLRTDVSDATHHIAALAVERERVFREPADRRRLLTLLGAIVDLYAWNCRAFCLMGTHFHLIVHTPQPNLSRGMQHLCGVYAQWFNWKYARRGHLFGRRFGSVHIVSDEHLYEAHRYVALNPVRAGLCARPEFWRWGSFRSLLGLEEPPPFLDVAGTLGLFAPRQAVARAAFSRFINAVDLEHEDVPLVRITGA